MYRRTLILALAGLLTPSLALGQSAPVRMGYTSPAGAAVPVTAAAPLPTTAAGDAELAAAIGATSTATPTSAVLMGAADSVSGTLMPVRTYDADTGAGNDFRLGTVPILPGAGGGTPASAGAGINGAGVQRMTLATDDAAVVSLGTLDDVVHADGAAVGKAVLLGAKVSGPNTVSPLLQTSGSLQVDQTRWNGTAVATGAGDSSTGTLRVVQAAIATGASTSVDVDASEKAVLAAKAGRRFARVQVYADVDGAVCCSLGATTTACATGIMLDASPAAGKAGGSAEWEGYGGAITCRAAGAWTTTVRAEEW